MRPKLSCPPDFGGERHNGCTFLNSCSLYIRLAPEQFHNEEERILWALTFFKSGHAAKWSENVFHQEADTGVFPIRTWRDFEQQFRVHFFLANAEADAINALEGTSYHQGGRTVDDYLDNFQALVSDAGYTDPRMLVVKFWRGLRLGIQNQIATMPYGRPANTDPDAWYRAARRIDQARLANEAFQSVSRSAPSAPPDPHLCPWQGCPLLCPFQSLRSLRRLLCLWESLWTSTRLERQGPCLHEDVTNAETQTT